jgi:hypothetical protein
MQAVKTTPKLSLLIFVVPFFAKYILISEVIEDLRYVQACAYTIRRYGTVSTVRTVFL